MSELRIAKVLYRSLASASSKTCTAPDKLPQTIEAAAFRMVENIRMRVAVGKLSGVRVIQIIQPIPVVGMGHASYSVPNNLINLGPHHRSALAFQKILDWVSKLHEVGDVHNLSQEYIFGPMYIDSVHYSPEFNAWISKRIKALIDESDVSQPQAC